MSPRRGYRFSRRDTNHNPIVAALEAAGVAERDLSHVGDGVSDLLVQHRKTRALMLREIKRDDKAKLTEAQEKFRKEWPVTIVRSVAEALAAVGIEVA